MNKEFEKQVLISIERIRNWEKLTLWEKIWRDYPRPSQIDYRLSNVWINKQDALSKVTEVKK